MANRVTIEVVLDDKGAVTGLRGVTGAVKELDAVGARSAGGVQGLVNSLGGLKGVLGGLSVGLAVRELKAMADEAGAEDAIFARLAQSVANTGRSWQAAEPQAAALVSRMQELTRFGDDLSGSALATLTARTHDWDRAMSALPTVLDAAVGSGRDLQTTAEAVGNALAGNTRGLRSLGVNLDAATKKQLEHADAAGRARIVLDALQDTYGGSAAADLQTYAGKIEQLGNYWGDLREEVGKGTIALTTSRAGFSGVIDVMEFMRARVKDLAAGIAYLSELVKTSAAVIGSVYATAIGGAARAIGGYLELLGKLPWAPDALGSVGAGMSSFGTDLLAGVEDIDLEYVAGAFDRAEEAMTRVQNAMGKLTSATPKLGKGFDDTADDADKLAGALRNLEAIEKAQVARWADALGVIGEGQNELEKARAALAAYAQSVDTYWPEIARTGGEAARTVTRHLEELRLKILHLQHLSPLDVAVVDQTRNQRTLDWLRNGGNWQDQGPQLWMLDNAEWEADIARNWPQTVDRMRETLADGLSDGIIAAFRGDDLADVWEDVVNDLANTASQSFSRALQAGMQSQQQGGTFGEGFQGAGGWQAAGMMVGAGFMAYAQAKQSVLAGAIGGAIMGGMSTMSVWGAVAGAIMGAWTTYQQNQANQGPETRWGVTAYGGYVDTRGNQGFTEEMRESTGDQMVSMYWATMRQYADILRQLDTATGELWSTLGDLPHLLYGEGSSILSFEPISVQNMLQVLEQQRLPEMWQTYFGEALATGLRRVGLSDPAIAELWAELGNLPGPERVQALATTVATLVDIARLTEELEFGNLTDLATMTGLEGWARGFGEFQEAISRSMIGIDTGPLLERVAQGAEAVQLIEQAGAAIAQALQQVEQAARQVRDSFRSQAEQISLAMMGEDEQGAYALGRIRELQELLGSGTLSWEEIQQYSGQLQQYIGMLFQLFQGQLDWVPNAAGGQPAAMRQTGLLDDVIQEWITGASWDTLTAELTEGPMDAFRRAMGESLADITSMAEAAADGTLEEQRAAWQQISETADEALGRIVDVLEEIRESSERVHEAVSDQLESWYVASLSNTRQVEQYRNAVQSTASALDAVTQAIAAIDASVARVHASVQQQLETWRLSGMTPQEIQRYAYGQVGGAMGQLGGATSLEGADAAMASLQRYLDMIFQQGSELEGGAREQMLTWLEQQLTAGQAVYDQRAAEFRAAEEARQQVLVDALDRLTHALEAAEREGPAALGRYAYSMLGPLMEQIQGATSIGAAEEGLTQFQRYLDQVAQQMAALGGGELTADQQAWLREQLMGALGAYEGVAGKLEGEAGAEYAELIATMGSLQDTLGTVVTAIGETLPEWLVGLLKPGESLGEWLLRMVGDSEVLAETAFDAVRKPLEAAAGWLADALARITAAINGAADWMEETIPPGPGSRPVIGADEGESRPLPGGETHGGGSGDIHGGANIVGVPVGGGPAASAMAAAIPSAIAGGLAEGLRGVQITVPVQVVMAGNADFLRFIDARIAQGVSAAMAASAAERPRGGTIS